jgi:hypothetical protein
VRVVHRLSVDAIAQAGSDPIRRLRLRALEEPFRNDEICVLHPIENVEPDEIPELDILRPGEFGYTGWSDRQIDCISLAHRLFLPGRFVQCLPHLSFVLSATREPTLAPRSSH